MLETYKNGLQHLQYLSNEAWTHKQALNDEHILVEFAVCGNGIMTRYMKKGVKFKYYRRINERCTEYKRKEEIETALKDTKEEYKEALEKLAE